jgi:hypothetical protein
MAKAPKFYGLKPNRADPNHDDFVSAVFNNHPKTAAAVAGKRANLLKGFATEKEAWAFALDMDEPSLQVGEGSLPCAAEFAEKLEARKQGRSASEREAAEQLAAAELAAVGSNLLMAALGNGGQHGGQNVGLELAAGSASLLSAGKQPRLTGMSNASEGFANGSLSNAPKAQFHAPPTASILGAGPSVNTDPQLLVALKQMSGNSQISAAICRV